jgi:hypothetical protein
MQNRNRSLVARRLAPWLAVLVVAVRHARADTGIENAWLAAYPSSTTDDAAVAATGSTCVVCHFTPTDGSTWNAYGWKMRENILSGQTVATAIANAGPPNSDLDPAGWTNLAEIALGAQPGWTPGASNTCYYKTSTSTNQPPPAALAVVLDPACNPVSVYCTSGTTSIGCLPAIAGIGQPSASAGSGFTIQTTGIEGERNGFVFHGVNGPAATPWGPGSTSYSCVASPVQRSRTQYAGGMSGQCDGVFALDWNNYIATHPGALGQPFGGGEIVWAQVWFRDPPAPRTTNLSNGLMFQVCP